MPAKKSSKTPTKNELFEKIRKADICEIAHKLKDCCKDGEKRADEARFAIFLGAGASVAAGIKTAGQMMNDFREKILTRDCPTITDKKTQTKWLRDNILSKGTGNEYSKLFEYFERTPKGRQNYVSKLLKGKEPTFGYAMLSSLIARGFVNTILTTNFDDMVFIGCTKFSGVRPVIYAYGIMATEMKFSSPHPKILKIHGDYLYSALANTEIEMSQFNQDPNMRAQVTSALDEYELIVFGYGGNDESVMKILASYPPNKEFYWCHKRGEIPSQSVLELIEAKNGSLVAIEGFDEAMYDIYKIVDFELDEVLASYEERRSEILKYINEFDRKYPTKIVEVAIEEAKQESVSKIKPVLTSWMDYFLAGYDAFAKNDSLEAERFYRRAIELNPNNAEVYNNLGVVYFDDESRHIEAERAYRRAIELKPDFAAPYGNLGRLLARDPSRQTEAIEAVKRAVELDPSNSSHYNGLGNRFLDQGQVEEAIEAFKKGIELNSQEPNILLSLGSAFKKLGDTESAKLQAEKARKLLKKEDLYLLACYHGVKEEVKECLENLELAIHHNPYLKNSVKMDHEFDWIRENPRFKQLVDQ